MPTQPADSSPPAAPAATPETTGSYHVPLGEPEVLSAGRVPAPLAPPGYEILSELGHGGMGVVYLARQLGLRRLVALKMIRAGAHAGPEAHARFRVEAEAIARLHHPNIVEIHEVGEVDGCPFLSLEYVDGGNLARRVQGTPQPVRDSARLVQALAAAVHHAHGHGIVHRDLKPANILLVGEAAGASRAPGASVTGGPAAGTSVSVPAASLGDIVPKVTDFGLAKHWGDDPGATAEDCQTRTGAIVGTPSYMAPEQATGHSKEVGPAADVYSLGAILYALLTGRPPFQGATALETLEQVCKREPVPPRQLRPGVHVDLDTICLKCLQKEPGRRYAGAAELGEDLRRFLAGEPIKARPVGWLERGRRWARRNRGLAAALGLAALALVAVAVVSAAFALHASRAREDLRRERDLAEERRRAAERRLCENYLERGLSLCEADDPCRGLLWLARALEVAPEDAPDLERILRLNLAAWGRQVLPLRAILPRQQGLRQALFSADGKAVLVVAQNTLQRWDAATGRPLGPPLELPVKFEAAALSPDGKTVLVGGIVPEAWIPIPGGWAAQGYARLWDVVAGRPLGPPLLLPPEMGASRLTFSPDGKTALVGGGKRVILWEVATGNQVGPVLVHPTSLNRAVFSPDGKALLTAGLGAAQLWEVATGKPVGLPLEQPGLDFAAFDPTGTRLLTVGNLGVQGGLPGGPTLPRHECRLWDRATLQPVGQPISHDGFINAAFSPDGKLVLTASADRTARLWDAATGRPFGRPLRHAGVVGNGGFSPDGKLFLTGDSLGADRSGTVRLWETATGNGHWAPLYHPDQIGAPAFSPDGRTFLTRGNDAVVRLWGTGTLPDLRLEPPEGVLTATYTSDGKSVLTWAFRWEAGEWVGRLREWDAATGVPVREPFVHAGRWGPLACGPGGQVFLAHSDDTSGEASLWDLARRQPLGPRWRFPGSVRVAAFSPDGKAVLVGGHAEMTWDPFPRFGRGGHAVLLDPLTGHTLTPDLAQGGFIHRVAFGQGGKVLLTVWSLGRPPGGSGEVQRWDAATGRPLGPPLKHEAEINGLLVSPDGKTLFTSSVDHTVRRWDVATGDPLGPPLRHRAPLNDLALSPDGRLLLSGANDRTAQLWDAATGEPVRTLEHPGAVDAVAFSPDGRLVLTCYEDRMARLWDVATGRPIGPPLLHGVEGKDVFNTAYAAFRADGARFLTRGPDGRARLWRTPVPLSGRAEHVSTWAEALTGMELGEHGLVRWLDAPAWQERRERLASVDVLPAP